VPLQSRYIDEFGRERQVADAPPPSSALRIDSSSVKNTLEALKSQSSASASSVVSSLLSGSGGGAAGSQQMHSRVAKNMPAATQGTEQNCELNVAHFGFMVSVVDVVVLPPLHLSDDDISRGTF
jgi:hypothetical protein